MPQPVTVTENVWIPTADGTRLAARLWLPAGAGTTPVPAVLEYIPYRKRDGTRGRDEPMHGFFAAEGYAAVRVDMRGSGESDGLLDDEYLKQEQDDALDVIAWIAAQPWCTGAVGMMGKSWGGFNALQVAARRPPALKAIITVCSTDDRFGDDIHYKGGCLLNDNLWWGSIMLAYQARPLDPATVGERWRDAWLKRLGHMPFWPRLWLDHQRRDAYWQHGSVCEDWDAIQCPVLAVGGWGDAYTNAVPRLLAHLEVPRQGLIGPWAHIYPHDGVPGPAVDFLGEATRWWDTWLKGEETGVADAPMLRAFVEDWMPPSTVPTAAEGRFVAEPVWPSPAVATQVLHLGAGTLTHIPPVTDGALSLRSPLWTGIAGGEWMGTGVPGERPADQRIDDGHSLCFDSDPLAEPLEVLGFPVVELTLASDHPQGQIAVRLCDVAADGASVRVSYGVLNLTHRDGSGEPAPMEPGVATPVRVTLDVCGHRFPAGHRIRVAVSTSYWPLLWPARDPSTITLSTAGSLLALPVRSAHPAEPAVELAPPRHGPGTPRTLLREGEITRHVGLDLVTGAATVTIRGQGGLFGEGVHRFDDIGVALDHDCTRTLTIGPDDPSSAREVIEQRYRMIRPDTEVLIETTVTLEADAQAFRMTGLLKVSEGDAVVAERRWDERVTRDHL